MTPPAYLPRGRRGVNLFLLSFSTHRQERLFPPQARHLCCSWSEPFGAAVWTPAGGSSGHYTANTIVSFAGVPAKYVKLTIEKTWGGIAQTGLSEVRFFAIQTAAVPKP